MLLNPGVRFQTTQNYYVRAKDRAGGDYSLVFGAYFANQKLDFNTADPTASGGVSASFATLQAGSNLGSNAHAFFSCDCAVTMTPGPVVPETEVEILQIDSGAALMWGIKPKVRTRRLYTGGDGTKILIYVEPGTFPTVEHLVLVDPLNTDQARIYKLNAQGQPGANPDATLTNNLLYAKLDAAGTLTTSATVPAAIQAVVAYARQQAISAGY
ncbi:MAG: hypothetical protein IT436_18410 [Phycisphaerales bacterium]|nr:hypothetical protein [Phycisphaerales bacterium]